MNERELLELAAKANNDPKIYKDIGEFYRIIGRNEDMGCDVLAIWNPLKDNADCARLEAELKISIKWSDFAVYTRHDSVSSYSLILEYYNDHGGDKAKARRYASTRCAAEIGRRM